MKLRSLIASVAIALMATTFACTPAPNTQAPKPGKELPAEIEGAERVGDTLRTKPGFEWAKQPDGSMTLQKPASSGGGDGVIIRVACGCDTGPYACEAVLTGSDTIKCQNVRDCLACKFFRPDGIDIK